MRRGGRSTLRAVRERGTVDDLFAAWLAVPPAVADGAVLTPTVLLPGMVRPVSFRVRRRAAG